MARPKLKEEKRKVSVSLSVSRDVSELAESTGNSSHFFQASAECCRGMAIIVDRLRSKKLTLEDAMEEIEDIADVWLAEFDGTIPFVALEEKKRASR